MAQTLQREPPIEPPIEPVAGAADTTFASGARILSIGIASTGLFTFAYLATASHILSKLDYSRISICWAIMYVILSVIYRPIEQLLSRTIADRHARAELSSIAQPQSAHILRTPAIIQASFALVFLGVALGLHHTIEHNVLKNSQALYWILVVGVLAYAASYFARGWLAGNKRFALYGALVFLESTSRFLFAVAVALGVGSGLGAVGLGMAAAPFASLCVIPFAFGRVAGSRATQEIEVADAAREGPAHAAIEEAATDLSLTHGTGFAFAVVAIMLSEQTLMNAGVLVVAASSGGSISSGLAGFVFNVLLIVRAPLQLFQAVQTSILPHLAGLEARESGDEFRRAIRLTVLVITGFATAVAIGLLAIGPFVMKTLLGGNYSYGRLGLAVVGVGMGLHLVSGTLNQALLARGRARFAAAAWLLAGTAFVLFVATDTLTNQVSRVEVGYCGATGLLAILLFALYRQAPGTPEPTP